MAEFDIVIRNGEIGTAAGLIGRADIGIAGGAIVQIGGGLEGRQELDATGKLILPGGVDAHVHLSYPKEENGQPGWVDDFTSGSAAALAGGITTLGNMTFLTPGETPLAGLERETAVARDQTIADIFLHPVLGEITPQVLDEISMLLDVGCNSIKLFTVFPGFDTQVGNYVKAIRRAGASGLITVIHCEDYALKAQTKAAEVFGKNALRYTYGDTPWGPHGFLSIKLGDDFIIIEPNAGFQLELGCPYFPWGENGYKPSHVFL